MSAKSIRIVIADDHALFRHGLKSMLALEPRMQVVGEVDRVGKLSAVLAQTPCDVLLLDLQMDRWVFRDIERFKRVTSVVVVTASERVEDALAALKAGARAIVQKRFAPEQLLQAICVAAEGKVWMPPEMQSELVQDWSSPALPGLSGRERQIIRYVATGLRNAEVAERLQIDVATVKSHLNRIFHKLGIRDRVELVLHAFRIGLVKTPPRE
jgi:DNA-binding NarL/FixJ family response regulator